MIDRQPYTYVVLRYRHDPLAGELLNVGIVLHAPAGRFLKSAMRTTYGRFAKLYPDFDGAALTADLKRAQTALDRLAAHEGADLFADGINAGAFARRVLDDPAGAYLWGETGSGLTKDPVRELAGLYDRFIGRFDEPHPVHRTDAEVWKPARDRLAEHHLEKLFQPKTIVSPSDDVEFAHAWKNGVWHCVQPLSFDLSNATGIREKAARWVGHMVGLAKADEECQPYFVVGKPTREDLAPAFERALDFLAAAPGRAPRVVREEEINDFVDGFAAQVLEHGAEG